MTDKFKRMFDRIWCVDFEYFTGESGADAPRPICMVAIDLLSGDTIREWLWDNSPRRCPLSLDSRSLYVSHYASAELSCHLALGWEMPARILDLHAEFRVWTNGRELYRSDQEKAALKKNERHSLLACMFAFGLGSDAVAAGYKDHWRDICIRGGPFTVAEREGILDYCKSDVLALTKLFPRVTKFVDLGPALFRGRYMKSIATVERLGVPVDLELVDRLKRNWPEIVDRLIEQNRGDFDVIGKRDIDRDKYRMWLESRGLHDWPRTQSGAYASDSNTLSDWAKYIPDVMNLKEFLQAVRRTRLFDTLQIGSDGRNRFLASPFGSKTGRNTPSNSKSVFGPACWVRSIIQPPPGHALLYCDWSGQEYGEAAYFSGDHKMIYDYENDDPYLGFAKRIRLAPQYATKKSHAKLRDQLKVAAGLGVLYGAGPPTVARAGGMPLARASHLLREHKFIYPTFWEWRSQAIHHAQLTGEFRTCFGWTRQVSSTDSVTSLSNWMMQAHGAEMLRVACCLATEQGIEVCTTVHDAMLVQAPINSIDEVREATLDCMREASSRVLSGPSLKVGVEPPVIYPNHYSDRRGGDMWSKLMTILKEVSETT